MIVGVGIDLVEISRIRKLIARFGDAFTSKVFTAGEHHEAKMRKDQVIYYAGRWAVKEATAKALGCGIGSNCAFLDIETRNDPTGRPVIALGGAAAATAKRIGASHIHLSVSHEETYAVASVTLEK
jgi:holo-[acyl-carrier protein] synthase